MSDPDDDALRWAGDDRLQAPAGGPPRVLAEGMEDPAGAERAPSAGTWGGGSLVVLGVLGGIAVIETILWYRSVTELSIAASVVLGSDSPTGVAAYVVNIARRVLAVAAPLVWFGVALSRIRTPSKRLAWMLLGAVLLVPWPFLLEAA